MSDSDEMIVLAQNYIHGRTTLPQSVRDAFTDMPKAPLAILAKELIIAQPNSELTPLFESIAALNQGRIEDLNLPIFQSYLISKCATNEVQIRRVINAVKAFLSMNALSDRAVIAARDEQNSGRKAVTKAEILRLAQKRRK